MSGAVGHPSRMRMMSPRALRTMRAGVCHSCQRSRLGSARARGPVTQNSWNQRTRSAPQHTTASHAALAAKSVNGNRKQAGVFEPADVVLDVGVGPHLAVQGGGVAVLVGVVAPEPVFEVG